MRKTLLFIEKGLLAQLYKTNISVYLESEVVLCNNYLDLIKQLENMEEFILIVAYYYVDHTDMIKEMPTLITEKGIKIPTIIVGESGQDTPNLTHIKESLNIPNILGASARVLNITAQMMAAYKVPEYYPIDIEFIYYLNKAPTSLFLNINNEYVLFASKDTSISDIAQDLKEEGVDKFYIKSLERLEIVGRITETLKEKLKQSSKLNSKFKAELIAEGFDYFLDHYVSPEAGQEIGKIANDCSRLMTDLVTESNDLNALFMAFRSNKDNYLYIHTMLGSYVASHIVRNVPWGNETHVDKIVMVFFFHDLYLAPLYAKYPEIRSEEDFNNNAELGRQEKHTVLNHARLAGELVSSIKKSPIGIDQLIRQHHGVSTGIGFADEYKDDVSPLAKIVIIAESFVEFYLSKRGENIQAPFDILSAVEYLNEKFKLNSYRKIIETLITLKI